MQLGCRSKEKKVSRKSTRTYRIYFIDKDRLWKVYIFNSWSVCLNSQVLHMSGAAVLHAELKNSKVELLDNCGHAIALEKPRRAADILVDFLSKQEVKGKKEKKDPWWKYFKAFLLLVSREI